MLRVRNGGMLPDRSGGLFGREGVFGKAESSCIFVINQAGMDAYVGYVLTSKKDGTSVSTTVDDLEFYKMADNSNQKQLRPKYRGVSLTGPDREMIVILYQPNGYPKTVMRKSVSGADNQFTIFKDRIISNKTPINCAEFDPPKPAPKTGGKTKSNQITYPHPHPHQPPFFAFRKHF